MHTKDFTGWSKVKQNTEESRHLPTFQEREIWWCKVGVNIGHEVDGKNQFANVESVADTEKVSSD